MADLERTVKYRREMLEKLGIPPVRALRLATERNPDTQGFLVDVHRVEALIARGATPEQAGKIA